MGLSMKELATQQDALQQQIAAIAAAVGAGQQDASDDESDDATSKAKQTARKAGRVKVPSHTNRELAYRVEPDSKYKRYVLFTYLKDDGTDQKSVRVRRDILLDAIANADETLSFDKLEQTASK